jgi:hypothetical protein
MWLHWGVFVGVSNLHIAIMDLVKLNVACVYLVKMLFDKKVFESKNIPLM